MTGLFPRAAGALAILALAACASPAAAPGAHTDEFSDAVMIDSAHLYDGALTGPKYEWELQSTVGKAASHAVGHRLVVWIYLRGEPKAIAASQATDRIRYRFAADDTAAQLAVVPLDVTSCPKSYVDCAYSEEVAVPLGDAALRAHVLKGYRVKLWPTNGDAVILSLGAALLQKQLTEVDDLVQGASATPRAPAGAPRLGLAVIAATATPEAGAPAGVIVIATVAASPAALAGIAPGDVPQAIGPDPVRDSGDMARIMAGLRPGSTVSLALVRDGKRFTADVRL
jgi:hypothetical protein